MKTTHHECKYCGSSDASTTYENGVKCFSCGKFEYLKSISRYTKKSSIWELNNFKELPPKHDDYFFMVYKWLLENGIHTKLIKKYNLYYNIDLGLVIPSYYNGKLLGYQCRSFNKNSKYKYWQPEGQKPLLFIAGSELNSEFVVIVEDAISAIRLGEFTTTVALLGTNINSKQLELLKDFPKRYIIWLDSDKPGRTAARKLKIKLELVGEVLEVNEFLFEPKKAASENLNFIRKHWELRYGKI